MPAKVAGSVALTPKSRPAIKRVKIELEDQIIFVSSVLDHLSSIFSGSRVSQSPAEIFVQVIAEAMAELQLRSVVEDDLVIAAEPGLELTNAIQVDDGRTSDALKFTRVEFGFQAADGFAEEMPFPVSVQQDVIALRLDPFDLVRLEKEDAAFGLDDKSFKVARLPLGEHREDSLMRFPALLGFDLSNGATQRLLEALAIEGL